MPPISIYCLSSEFGSAALLVHHGGAGGGATLCCYCSDSREPIPKIPPLPILPTLPLSRFNSRSYH